MLIFQFLLFSVFDLSMAFLYIQQRLFFNICYFAYFWIARNWGVAIGWDSQVAAHGGHRGSRENLFWVVVSKKSTLIHFYFDRTFEWMTFFGKFILPGRDLWRFFTIFLAVFNYKIGVITQFWWHNPCLFLRIAFFKLARADFLSFEMEYMQLRL